MWGSLKSYIVSLLKAWWGDAATTENDFAFDYLPRIDGDHSHYPMMLRMIDGETKGFIVIGQNPVVGSANGGAPAKALAQPRLAGRARPQRDRDGGLLVRLAGDRGGRDSRPSRSAPRCSSCRPPPTPRRTAPSRTRSGCCSGTSRPSSRRQDCRSDLWFTHQLGQLRARQARGLDGPQRPPAARAHLGLPDAGARTSEPDAETIMQEISGRHADGSFVAKYQELAGRRLDHVRIVDPRRHLRRRRQPERAQEARRRAELDRTRVGLGVAGQPPHPLQPRIRGPRGQPVVGAQALRVVGRREGKVARASATNPTSSPTRRPTTSRRANAKGMDAINGDSPFILHPDGLGWLYAAQGLVDGPLPTHYEPHESPFANALYERRSNPTRQTFERPENPYNPPGTRARRRGVPVRAVTTYRADRAPHRRGHVAQRPLSWPSCSRRCSARSARSSRAERGLEHGGWATIVTTRAAIEARVLVTDRIRSRCTVDGAAACTRSACPTTGAARGSSTGDAGNELLPLVLDQQRAHLRVQGRHLRHPPRARGRAGAALRELVEELPPARGGAAVKLADAHVARRATTARPGRAWASSPTRASASAARRARSPARSGTGSPDRRRASPATPTTTRSSSAPTPGGTSRSSSSARRSDRRTGGSLVQSASLEQLLEQTGLSTYQDGDGMRWLMASDVCKHCTDAACLEVCPTGALFRTEFGTVVVQEDVCNGCGYCVPACPFGVLDRREEDGRVWKCTLCYDRLKDDKEPACAQACPTHSIQFGELDDLRERAQERLAALREAGAEKRAAVPPRRGRRRRRRGRVLPAARRARGLRAAARPRRHDARPRLDLGARSASPRPGSVRRSSRRSSGGGDERSRRLRRAAGPSSEPRHASYYGQPVIKEPVWTPEIPVYFFVGGLAGASATLAALRRAHRPSALARRAWLTALAGAQRQPGAADLRPRAPGALSEHAADVQGHLADERRLVGAGRQRRDDGRRGAARASTGRFARARAAREAARGERSGCRCRPTPAR